MDLIANQAGYKLDWTLTAETEFINASIHGFHGDDTAMAVIFDKITMPLSRQQQRDQLLSEPTKKELQEYLKLLQFKETVQSLNAIKTMLKGKHR